TTNGTPPPPPAPVVTSISPNSGPSPGGTMVTITGSGFTGATGVSFGGVAANNSTGLASAVLTGGTSAASDGTAVVEVMVSGNWVVWSGGGGWGVSGGGARTNVAPSNVPSFRVVSDSQIIAFSPPVQLSGATATVDVTVTTPNGTSATTSADQFTYVNTGTTPAVVSVSPNSGPAG